MKFKLPSLEYRRLRGDLIEVYKIMHKFYDPCTVSSLFTLSDVSSTRGHKFKLTKSQTTSKQYQQFFTNRTINYWNNLDHETVMASSVNVFKNKIDSEFKNYMFEVNLHNKISNSIH